VIAIGLSITRPVRRPTGDRVVGPMRQHGADILLTGMMLLLSAAGAIAGEAHTAFFAEPASGRKVTHYSIELPIKRDRRQRFNIPDDCAEVMKRINGGAIYRGSIMDRGLWRKIEGDCRYHGFLNRHPQPVLEDHVSSYDFRNLRIADLPLDRRCTDSGPGANPPDCDPAATNDLGMLHHFPITTPAADVPVRADCTPCALRNGRFRGYVVVTAGGIECRIDANAPGVRLIAVDFADINGDRILDAVLRFIPLGSAGRRAQLVLPLTRLKASGPLSIPAAGTAPSPADP